ncbi:MAG TPA: hypothetical protein PKG54_02110 [Phycisphaerae bacterium]|jgi:hypothetical protein|nr:hypothetical protein [Phycisphaerae bacterium]HOB73296.1 hypothetical protein [Phycisphaerae bacterium]HOJ55722.1 hypothetical protein [Phycisphaerae bacterium]HOL26115.1 hypothetical protein [Phycisphaerae bacterium]HPP22031.1 hypothetical protein [Phycisphaerae bacterium]
MSNRNAAITRRHGLLHHRSGLPGPGPGGAQHDHGRAPSAYGGPLTEIALLGITALRYPGQELK